MTTMQPGRTTRGRLGECERAGEPARGGGCRRLAWLAIAVVAVGTATTGCNSKDSNDGPIPLDDVMTEFVSAECAILVRCHFASDLSVCQSWLGASSGTNGFNTLGAIVSAVKAGKVQYDGAAARACLDSVSAQSCTDVFTTANVASCQRTFMGTVADGARCIADSECGAGSFCARPSAGPGDPQSCDGTCTHGGTLCNDDTQCAGGMACDTSLGTDGSNGACVAQVPAGAANQPCGTNRTCQAGLNCAPSAPGGGGGATSTLVCLPAGALGMPCDPVDVEACQAGLVCIQGSNGASPTCLAPVAKGQPCQTSTQCGGTLFRSLACDQTTHVCVAAPSSGPCLGQPAFECDQLTSFCDISGPSPTCKPIVPIGGACSVAGAECGPIGATCQPSSPLSPTGTCVRDASCTP